MVAKKAAKAAKASYAERVLGAFTSVQREHKKHAIHIATLRAQVKKTAQENKETLGPQWSTWVGKAIHKLEDEGIFEASQTSVGNITLTPAGKKTITAARQSLALAMNTSPSTVPEDVVWKHVTQTVPYSRGLKRGRRSSIRANNGRELNSQEDASWSISAPRSKRPRTSTTLGSPAKKSICKMKKAELQEEIRTLQKEHEDVLWLRASSPLTDLDEDDAEEMLQLRQELQDREEEVERIRRQLPGQGESCLSSQRPPTSTIDETPNILARSRALNGVIRTTSGSCISVVSKRPTPAPSSAGSPSEAINRGDVPGHENDDFVMQEDNDHRDFPSPSQHVHGATTAVSKELELERDLGTRAAEIEELKAQISQLEASYSKVQQALVERDDRLSVLSGNVADLEKAAAEKTIDFDHQTSELLSLKAAKGDLELSYSSRLKEMDQDIQERDSSIHSLKVKQEKTLAELSRLQELLSTTERSKATLASQLAAAEVQTTNLRSDMGQQQEAAKLELETQHSISTELEKKVQALLARTSELDEQVDELQRSESGIAASFAHATAQQALVSEQLHDAETKNESLLSLLSSAQDAKSASDAALKVSEDTVARLTSQITVLDASISQDKANIEGLTQSLAAAQEEVVALRQQVATTEVSVSTLRSELDLSKQTTDELTTKLAAATDERADIAAKLGEAHMTISASASAIIQLKELSAKTTDNLKKSESAAAELQANLDATVDRLNAEKERNQGLLDVAVSKDRELKRLRESLSIAESTAERLQGEATASDKMIRALRLELEEARDEVSAAHGLLSSTKTTHARENDKQASVISGLQSVLQTAQTQIEGLKSELESARSVSAELQAVVDEQSTDLGEAGINLDSERQRASRLESDLVAAIGKAQEVEEELSELKASKEADEATIENLKGMFSALRDTQMKSLAELDSKVVSTKSSPAPKRRTTRTTAAKAKLPFKLT